MKDKLIFYISLVFIVLIIVSIYFFLFPYYNNFQKIKKNIENKEIQIEKEKEYSLYLEDTYNKMIQYQAELEKIESIFPEKDLVIPEFYNFIRREATYGGVILTSIGMGGSLISKHTPNLEKNIFSISFFGSYSASKNFLSVLYNSSRVVSIDSVSITSSGQEDTLNVSLNLGFYSHNN